MEKGIEPQINRRKALVLLGKGTALVALFSAGCSSNHDTPIIYPTITASAPVVDTPKTNESSKVTPEVDIKYSNLTNFC